MAVRRLNSEVERRRRLRAATEHVASARRALAMKQASADNGGAAAAFNSRQAHHGMRNMVSQKRQQLINPMERGRLRKAQAVAQAKRDAR
jgi:hypothetical protein